jgi:hypothetical protein
MLESDSNIYRRHSLQMLTHTRQIVGQAVLPAETEKTHREITKWKVE